MQRIIKVILDNCDKISKVNYCRAYKWMLGEEVPVKVLNGALYTIGAGKYIYPHLKKEDILIIVSTGSGKSGIVFALNGIYYKSGSFCGAYFKEYEECKNVHSCYELMTGPSDIFSEDALNDMFAQVQGAIHGISVTAKGKSSRPYNYGKYIDNKAVQEPFRQFLAQETKESNQKADHYWIEATDGNDISEKVRLLSQGISEGSALCSQELGKMYFAGDEVQKDLKKAEEYLWNAAECGLPNAMWAFGLICMDNDENMGLNWMCRAAVKGDINACQTLAKYASQDAGRREQIEARLSVYYQEICDKEERKGEENQFLGWCSAAGICCVQNFDLAEIYWIEGKEQGSIYCSALLDIYGFEQLDDEKSEKNTANDIKEDIWERVDENTQFKNDRGNKKNKKAVASVIIGVMAYLGFWWFSIIGLIIGILAVKDQEGKLAIMGVVVNALALIGSVAAF